MDATIDLLVDGRTPSVGDIADAAEVSRRTVYLHFPSLEHLLLDATVGALSQSHVEAALADPNLPEDPEMRVEHLVRAVCADAVATMDMGRRLIQLSAAPALPGQGSEPRRGYRRISWIEKALEPAAPLLDPDQYDQLVSALTVVVGWEAIIALHDIRNLEPDHQQDTLVWMARALVRDALHGAKAVRISEASAPSAVKRISARTHRKPAAPQ